MSFAAGTLHVICPRCGAPVEVPANVAWVGLTEYAPGHESNNIVVLMEERITMKHQCKVLA